MNEPVTKKKRAIYITLLAIALMASGYSLYNQFASDSATQSLADQVSSACEQNPILSKSQGLNCAEAKAVQQAAPPVIKGEKGDPGLDGIPGPQGPPGPQGDGGPNGTNGPSGEPGPTGVPGASGSDGANGVDGTPGTTGPAGPSGPAGPEGPKGETGAQGPAGNDGADAPKILSFSFQGDGLTTCKLVVNLQGGAQYNLDVPNKTVCLG